MKLNGLLIGAAACAVFLAGCNNPADTAAAPAAPAAEPAAEAPKPAVVLPPADPVVTAQRVSDLKAVHAALEAYHTKNGAYPKSDGWQGYVSAWGADLGDNWIPELTPAFIAALPRDPTKSDKVDGAQYIYTSDGKDYKLLAHGVNDCTPAIEADGIKIDPVRGCPLAYGFWTAGAEKL